MNSETLLNFSTGGVFVEDDSSFEVNVVFVLNYVDTLVRILCLVFHLAYFGVVLTHKELKAMTMFQMHHINLIGLINSLNYVAWIGSINLSIEDSYWFDIVCTLEEAAWAVVKMARAYSILVLAVFRFVAVFEMSVYKRISKSYLWNLGFLLLAWLIPLLIFIAAKHISKTRFSPTLCADGYSTVKSHSVIYYLISLAFGYLIPTVSVTVLYILVSSKLSKLRLALARRRSSSRRLKKSRSAPGDRKWSETSVLSRKTVHESSPSRPDKYMAFQLVTLNSLEFLSAFTLNSIIVFTIYPSLSQDYYYLRQLLRILSNLFLTLIPVTALAFSPFKIRRVL